jgi:hypothetical protein
MGLGQKLGTSAFPKRVFMGSWLQIYLRRKIADINFPKLSQWEIL